MKTSVICYLLFGLFYTTMEIAGEIHLENIEGTEPKNPALINISQLSRAERSTKGTSLCGNQDESKERCRISCVAGGFYHGLCGKTSRECFCYNKNPEKGFIIEKREPVLTNKLLKGAAPGGLVVDGKTEQNPKDITDWFQSFNFYPSFKCDPCLCPAGCAIYGYFSGFCTSGDSSECMCATSAKKPN